MCKNNNFDLYFAIKNKLRLLLNLYFLLVWLNFHIKELYYLDLISIQFEEKKLFEKSINLFNKEAIVNNRS